MQKLTRPEAFPEHLRPYLLSIPKTERERLYLLVYLSEVHRW